MSKKNINHDELLWWWRELGLMLKHRVPLKEALFLLSENNGKKGLDQLAKSLYTQFVEEGKSLSESLATHAQYFNATVRCVIHVAEEKGDLVSAINQIVCLMTVRAKIDKAMRTALNYPMILCGLILLVSFIAVVFVLPVFEEAFLRSSRHELPMLSALFLNVAHLFFENFLFVLLACIAILLLWRRCSSFRYRLISTLPFVRVLAREYSFLQFLLLMPYASKSEGLHLQEMSKGLSNSVHRQELMAAYQEGEDLYMTLRKTSWVSARACKMIEAGVKSNALKEFTQNLFELSIEQLCNSVELQSKSLRFSASFILALVIAFLVIACYLPLFQMINFL